VNRHLTPSELLVSLEHFLIARRPPQPRFFVAAHLPAPENIPYRTVHLERDTLERFRSDFAELTAFVCAICRVRPEDLSQWDLSQAIMQQFHVEEVLAAAKILVETIPPTDPDTAVALRRAEHNLRALGLFGQEPPR
jgi:hypothetical protein